MDVWGVSRTADKKRSFSFGILQVDINCKDGLGIEMRGGCRERINETQFF